jgi:aminoglycoside phosphotransferase (APT) family kinase protein
MSGDARVDALETITARLAAFVREHYGADAVVRDVQPMPGHAGLSFGFEVHGRGRLLDAVVLRIPPRNVRRSGNTDVLRQAPLLRGLAGAGLPVPRVLWAGDDEQWFGVPYLMVERLSGETCFPWDPQPAWSRTGTVIPDLWRLGAQALTQVHGLDWERHLAGWAPVQSVESEIARWQPIYAQSPEPAWAQAADELRRALLGTLPADAPVGLVHGDYQIGNLLFDQGRVNAIIDWELSGLGARLIDCGWFLTFADPESWHPEWGPVNPAPVDELKQIYEHGMGERYPDLDWYRALAGYRMGSIVCINVKLHRRGHRPDPLWERYALAAPHLFAKARRLLQHPSSTRSTA